MTINPDRHSAFFHQFRDATMTEVIGEVVALGLGQLVVLEFQERLGVAGEVVLVDEKADHRPRNIIRLRQSILTADSVQVNPRSAPSNPC